ncbi:MAG: hypothetical protein LBU89_13985 [Fibromonadaceae bacterium]|jgi:rhamnogalacturonan endolyase|nr:hypothetical protein [Fibromonadaceae bacterium]
MKTNFSLRCTAIIFALLYSVLLAPVFAGPMQVEKLNRGLIAVRMGQGYYLSWRLLANEPYNVGFNVYRGTTKLNTNLLTGATTYTDASAAQNSVYTVRAVLNNVEQPASEQALIINNTEGANAGYLHIPLQRPPTGTNGGTYSPNDGSVGDLDGDGIYEIVLKWDPSNAKDNSQSGVTDNVFLDAYKLDGTRMWRIDLGPNIRAGAHYTQFMVYDFDGCGKAEIMVKTAEGTKDGTGAFISMGPAASANHSAIRRNSSGYVLSGPEYITVFEGATGKELATADYWPARGTVSSWGDNYGNRVDRFNAVVAYLDGERPTGVFQRGYYTRMTFAAWDWRNGQLTRRWTFDSNTSGYSNYAGQGNHQLSVADADGNGRHDIFTGSAIIRHDGTGMWRSGWGHGDALHVAHMIKNTSTPQIFMPYESGSVGAALRQANNGSVIFRVDDSGDVGRGTAAELDASRPGFKFWWNTTGLFDLTGTRVGNRPSSVNHVIWWDGDLTRALLNGNTIDKWSISNNRATNLLNASGASSINGTKSNPVLQADIFGDWREEVIFAHGNSALRLYTTTMPTPHRLVTMMHDPVYRVAVAWQNSSYNQPPHPGYYIASDMNFPPPTLDVVVVGSTPNILPTATITAPANNTAFMPGQTINITATASTSSGTITKVEFFNGTAKLGESTSSPYTFAWTNPPAGVHAITARATNDAGFAGTSAAVSVIVGASIGSGDYIEDLILFDPNNVAAWSINSNFGVGSKIFGDRDFAVGSLPTDLQGAPEWISTSMETRRPTLPPTMAQFKMKQDGIINLLYEDRVTEKPAWLASAGFVATSQKMTVTGDSQDRTFTLYTKSANQGDVVTLGTNSNNGTTSCMMYMLAFTGGNRLPTTSVTAPVNGLLATLGQPITITATASDPDGSVAKVEFFNGTTKLGESAAAPYTFVWTNPPAGAHTITARATDNSGGIGVSEVVNVIVGSLIGSGDFIENLILFDPANAAAWSINQSFDEGVEVFGDRAFTATSVPEELQGAEWISSSMETRRHALPETFIQFTMKKDAIVNLLYEDRVYEIPDWVAESGFVASEQKVVVTGDGAEEGRSFTVFTKSVSKDDVIAMGVNTNDGMSTCMMYLVAFTEDKTLLALNIVPTNLFFSVFARGKTLFVETSSPTVLDIFDLKGKKVASYNVQGAQTLRLNLQSGVYFAKARGMQSVKFVVR